MNKLQELENEIREFERGCNLRIQELRRQSSDWVPKESELLDNVHRQAPIIKNKFKLLEQWIMNEDGVLSPTEVRMFQHAHSRLKKKFVESLRRLNEEHKNSESLVSRKVKNMKTAFGGGPDRTDQALSDFGNIIEDATDVAYQDQLLETRSKDNAILANMYAREMLPEVQQMEKQIVELHQLFLEMSNLVDIQGELFAPIEFEVQKAIAHTAEGLEILQAADKHAVGIRKKKLMIVAMVVAAIGVTIMIVAAIGALCAAAMGLFA